MLKLIEVRGLVIRRNQRIGSASEQELTLDNLQSVAYQQATAEIPLGNDERIASFGHALFELLEYEQVRSFFEKSFKLRNQRRTKSRSTPEYMFNLTLRAVQKQVLIGGVDLSGIQYPEAVIDPDIWKDIFMAILSHTGAAGDASYDIAVRDIQSNVSDRYKVLMLLEQLFQDRFGPQPLKVDVGASMNLGYKHEALHHEIPFDELSVLTGGVVRGRHFSKGLTEQVAELIEGKDYFPGDCAGVDLWHPRDIGTLTWIEGCSFYPRELLAGSQKHERFLKLKDTPVESVHYVWDDFIYPLDPARNALDEWLDGRKPQIVSMFAVNYELSQESRARAFQRAIEISADDAIIVVFDFLKKQGRHTLMWADPLNLPPFNTRLLLYDKKAKHPGLNEAARFNGGRPTEMWLEPGSLVLHSLRGRTRRSQAA